VATQGPSVELITAHLAYIRCSVDTNRDFRTDREVPVGFAEGRLRRHRLGGWPATSEKARETSWCPTTEQPKPSGRETPAIKGEPRRVSGTIFWGPQPYEELRKSEPWSRSRDDLPKGTVTDAQSRAHRPASSRSDSSAAPATRPLDATLTLDRRHPLFPAGALEPSMGIAAPNVCEWKTLPSAA